MQAVETLLRICGAAFIALVALALLKTARPEFVLPLRLAAAAILFCAAFAASEPVISYLKELAEGLGLPEETAILFRAMGAALLTQVCAGICREHGEATLASGVALAGRGPVLVPWLPLFGSVLSLAEELLE